MTMEERAGHEMTLAGAHRDYEKDMNRYSFYKTHDRALCEDLVQDTFLKTWSYLAKGGKILALRAFLYHILNNLIIDQYRKQRNKFDSLDDLMEGGFEPNFHDDADTMIDVLDGKRASLLIPSLPSIYQKPMHMKYIQELSLSEMSAITGESKNTIAVKLHRGLSKLKSLYFPAETIQPFAMY